VSKMQKRKLELFSNPPPKDYRWEDLVAIMRSVGFSETCNGGSHYTFQHTSGYTFIMTKTHPSGILKLYQVKDAKEAWEKVMGDKNG
jgi:predicted RNA binding protein YcfA (HicA-like mRNA interferase family)